MRKATLLAALLLAAPLALGETNTVHERNVAFLWSLFEDADPSQAVAFADGRTMPLAGAIEEAAARAGPVDLAALASGAAPIAMGNAYVGDFWLLSYGPGSCNATILTPGVPVFVPVDPQLWIYAGATGTMTGHAYYLWIYGWTLKTTASYQNADWIVVGDSDFYCFSFGGLHFAFLFVNGAAIVES